MSGYLTRLIPRERKSGEAPPLLPVVRSVSPIARHDQRIGALEVESYALVGASTAPSEPEQDSIYPDETEAGRRTQTAPKAAGDEAAVQRKTLTPPETASPPTPGNAQAGNGDGAQSKHPVRPSGKMATAPGATERETGGSVGPAGPVVDEPHAGGRLTDADSPISAAGGPDVFTGHSMPAATPTEPAEAEENPGGGPRVASHESIGLASPLSAIPPDPLAARDQALRRPFGPTIRTRRPPHPDDSGSIPLEPKPRAFVEPIAPLAEDAAGSSRTAEEASRVVIGRINVEVIQPSEQPAGPVPSPQPLTAETASVIGPLRGGGRSDSRFSPRSEPWR